MARGGSSEPMTVQDWDPTLGETSGGILVTVVLAAPASVLGIARSSRVISGLEGQEQKVLGRGFLPSLHGGRSDGGWDRRGASAEPLGPSLVSCVARPRFLERVSWPRQRHRRTRHW